MKHMRTSAQHGFAIISAIVILVILAGLGAFALSFSTAQHFGSAQDIMGIRALNAARSGLEWGAYRQRIASSCAVSTNVDMSAATSMAGFTVTVTCDSDPDPSGRPTTVTIIRSTACNEPSGGACPNITNPSNMYIERQVEILF